MFMEDSVCVSVAGRHLVHREARVWCSVAKRLGTGVLRATFVLPRTKGWKDFVAQTKRGTNAAVQPEEGKSRGIVKIPASVCGHLDRDVHIANIGSQTELE